MKSVAPGATSTSFHEERGFLVLSVFYWVCLSLANPLFALGLFYIVLPLWVWFAYRSVRSATAKLQVRAARLLAVSVGLWISSTVPALFFVVIFGLVWWGAMTSAILFATLVVYYGAQPLAARTPGAESLRRRGLVAGAITGAVLPLALTLAFYRRPRDWGLIGPVPVADVPFLVMLGTATVAGVCFYLIGRKARVRDSLSRQ